MAVPLVEIMATNVFPLIGEVANGAIVIVVAPLVPAVLPVVDWTLFCVKALLLTKITSIAKAIAQADGRNFRKG